MMRSDIGSLQVPGEMFTLAMEAKKTREMGVVGSTSNILDFIASKVKLALNQPFADKLQVHSLVVDTIFAPLVSFAIALKH